MESSDDESNNSFAWEQKRNGSHHGDESESGKAYKKKLLKQLFPDQEEDVIENSGHEVVRRKRLRSHSSTSPSDLTSTHDAYCYKPKYKKKRIESQCNDSEELLKSLVKQEKQSQVKEKTHKKKNKKSNKRDKSEKTTDSENDTKIEDKFSAEEAIVEMRNSKDPAVNLKKSKAITATSKEFIEEDSSSDEETNKSKSRKFSNSEIMVNGNNHSSTFRKPRRSSENVSSERTTRKTKISELIQFEDDDLLEERGSGGLRSPLSCRMGRVVRARPALRALTHEARAGPDLTQHDRVWIIKCATPLCITGLKDTDVLLDNNKCRIKIDNHTYTGIVEGTDDRAAILTFQKEEFVIKNVPVMGMMHLCKRIPKPHFVECNGIVNDQTDLIPLPETKCRHPLFGLDYKRAIRIPKRVKERLGAPELKNNNMDASVTEALPKRMKKKKLKKEPQSDMEQGQGGASERGGDNSDRGGDNNERRARNKRPRFKQPDDYTWGSEKAIEQNLFNY